MYFILGPTASGKSDIAVAVAERCGAEIVGADAFQIYAGLDMLTAKPAPELLARVQHHLIGEIPLTETFDVARYVTLARQRIEEIQSRGKPALIVGGTGLYIRALTHGLAALPPANAALRTEFEALPLADLQERLRLLDPVAAVQIDLKNPRRVIRALEVCVLTGRPFSSFRDEWKNATPGVRGIVLARSQEELHARIERRTAAMFEQGVVEEVRDAGEVGATAAQTIGLREIRALLAGETSRDECIASIALATRQYAKRQLTWFRRETAFERIEISEGNDVDALAERIADAIAHSG